MLLGSSRRNSCYSDFTGFLPFMGMEGVAFSGKIVADHRLLYVMTSVSVGEHEVL